MAEPQQISSLISKQAGQESYNDLYNDVTLTDDEQALALLQARQKKYFDGKMSEYKKRIQSDVEHPEFTPTEIYTKVHEAGFLIDDSNKQIIWNLCRYFAGDPRGPYNLRKGVMLYGPVGCYKTSLMRFFANNQSNSFVVYPVNDVAARFAKEGHDGILQYKGFIPSTDTVRTFGQTKLGICFDDFGTEVDKKHYGNEANVMTEIILARFMSHENLMAKTHFTTNINSDIIEERYGIRVRSRLREMVNLVEFPDNSIDRRK